MSATTRGIPRQKEVEMMYLITDLKMVESYGRIKADSGDDALHEFAVSEGFLDLMEFASARPAFANDLLAVQLQ
ncbi:hypothetical protein [Paraburkholderia sp. CI3]|uniref:hypothetical protein n=2 Tax=Paraburkholderia TaxID=1822464 RepID=UPI003D233C3B